ncbi:MAG TPA: hypothetical protein VFZ34_10140 [Blastocatellia bacterium]|nr:hypothetical protein [Blastocatellia bacterium]
MRWKNRGYLRAAQRPPHASFGCFDDAGTIDNPAWRVNVGAPSVANKSGFLNAIHATLRTYKTSLRVTTL